MVTFYSSLGRSTWQAYKRKLSLVSLVSPFFSLKHLSRCYEALLLDKTRIKMWP